MESASLPFSARHIGPRDTDIAAMCTTIGTPSLDALIDATIPENIRTRTPLALPTARSEASCLAHLREIASRNQVWRSFIGQGYVNTHTPSVLVRNILENPSWYTPYTPYQAEISQGRLEALLNFQTMIRDLTSLPIANASLLDEATAAAEAMTLCFAVGGEKVRTFFVAENVWPQTLAVLQTRAAPLGIDIIVGDPWNYDGAQPLCGMLVQNPDSLGRIRDLRALAARVHEKKGLLVVAADILSLALMTPPGEMGADIAIGSTQRFGVPMMGGGPHAAYFAISEQHKRLIPGRLIGISKDAHGNPALRLSLQTREQHIRRERATSNICTAQALLAAMASMYALYHGPEGVRAIAKRVALQTAWLQDLSRASGFTVSDDVIFDTLTLRDSADAMAKIFARANDRRINVRRIDNDRCSITLDETVTTDDLANLAWVITGKNVAATTIDAALTKFSTAWKLPTELARTSAILTHPIFSTYHSETEMMRYLKHLEQKDISLTTAMTPLGSCTMKLNAASEMLPITWPEFANIHPFAPSEQQAGYAALTTELESWLATMTGFDAISLQPNAGSQGEFAGLVAIRAYHASRGEPQRTVCLIPTSAHGTNPASAVMAGFSVVAVACDNRGNIDLADLTAKAKTHAANLACVMITYPSTHGVFESNVRELCSLVHAQGGQVYMDGANMNAQLGLCLPGAFGVDVCHLNLHKTFCIPHGGGGPGVGPVCVKSHLAQFLPERLPSDGKSASTVGPVSAAPRGSAGILPISYAYIAMMGGDGLTYATKIAILSANYIAARLKKYFPVVFTGDKGFVAHECIVDVRPLKTSAGVEVEDVAKRLMDYGFHAPTMSWPIAGTLMIEPTESESKAELDRFCEAMIAIYEEAQAIADGKADRTDNVLKNAPHTATHICSDTWKHPYTREAAAFGLPWVRECKFWPSVARVDNAYGDRNLVCSCASVEELAAR